jgi:hypothetical protein
MELLILKHDFSIFKFFLSHVQFSDTVLAK